MTTIGPKFFRVTRGATVVRGRRIGLRRFAVNAETIKRAACLRLSAVPGRDGESQGLRRRSESCESTGARSRRRARRATYALTLPRLTVTGRRIAVPAGAV